MEKTVTLTLTQGEAIDVRMALNAASSDWGARAQLAREQGKAQEAQSCESIRASYCALWERIAAAQNDCCEFHASGGSRAFSCGGDTVPPEFDREGLDDYAPDDVRSWDATASRFPANRA
jgi:hypothetical protein